MAKKSAASTNADVKSTKKAQKRGNAWAAREVSAEERQRMVAEAAYYRAERRGFQGGSERQDWLEAEAEVSRRLSAT